MTAEQRDRILGVLATLEQLRQDLWDTRDLEDCRLRDLISQAVVPLHLVISTVNGTIDP